MNYYPHHIGDYVKDTAHLKMIEDGAYRRMLDLYYTSEKPLPLDRAKLYRWLRATSTEEQVAVDTVLADEFFVERDDGWHHNRCDAEIDAARAKSDKARTSAGLRWDCERNAKAHRTQCEGNAPNNQDPITNNQEPARRGSRLSKEWALPGEWRLLALKEQPTWTPAYCERVAVMFRNHWTSASGQRGVKLDWKATWHNWVLKEGPMDARRAPRKSLGDALDGR